MLNKKYNNDGGFKVDTAFVDNEPPEKLDIKAEVIEWLGVIASALMIVVILFGFAFRVAIISGDSMKNTLYDGEVVIITNLNYTPKCGDIVVVSRNAQNLSEDVRIDNGPIIKRVIATENQTVDIDFEQGIVYVDNVPLVENYISTCVDIFCHNGDSLRYRFSCKIVSIFIAELIYKYSIFT